MYIVRAVRVCVVGRAFLEQCGVVDLVVTRDVDSPMGGEGVE